jgi:hypothetical protein
MPEYFVGINMRGYLKSALVAMALGASTLTASAAVNFTSPNPFDTNGFGPGESLVWDFDSVANPNFSYFGSVLPVSIPGVAAAPAGDATLYGFAYPGVDATFQINSGSLSSLSFYLGSLDDYNTISFFSGATLIGSFTGSELTIPNPANGDQTGGDTNRRYFFTFGAADNVNRVVFNTTLPAFEFDDIAAAVSSVPEPSTWAMMILGFGLVGFSLRNNRRRIAQPVRS